MVKIGRNDPCPCGSGKKYKKCCADKETAAVPAMPDMDFDSFASNYMAYQKREDKEDITDLLKYDKSDILSVMSYLQALPENHGKNIRLESIQCLLLASGKQGEGIEINSSGLKSFFEKHFLYNTQEDPPENLFTENIMTPIGNKIIFSGLAQGQIYFLQQLMNVISMGDFESFFVRSCLSPALLLLSISDYIAKALEYPRNMRGVDTESNNIYVPDKYLERKNIFRIPVLHMEQLAISCGGNISDINLFLLDPEKEKWNNINPDENPIIHKPILYDSDSKEYIILSPTNLLYAALNGLLRKTIEYGKFDEVLSIYSHSCWQHSDFMLYNMGFRRLDYTFEETHLPIYEGLYIFDSDKLAYVVFFYDNGIGFNIDKPLEYVENKDSDKAIISHIKKVYNRLKSDKKLSHNHLLNLNISLGIGRPKSTRCPNNLDWNVLAMCIYELEVLSKSDKCNNLTFWNYSNALKSITLGTPFFLDNITYFIDNDESFYATDDNPVSWLLISVGNSLDFRVKAVQKDDIHLCETVNGGYIPVSRENLPAILPIYTTKSLLNPFLVSTPSLGSNVFIEPLEPFAKPQNEKERFESEICIAIAYWLFVLSEQIKKHLPLLSRPIEIKINLDDITDNYFETFQSLDKKADLFDKISSNISEDQIVINLDKFFLYHLIPENNYAERILMQKILYAICDIYWSKLGYNYEVIEAILKDNMPLSAQKKLIFKISDYDIRIIPQNVVTLKLSSPYALNRELDDLGKILTEKPYKPKDNLDTKTKKKLVNDVVLHFYNKLRILLQDYEGEDIIQKLLSLYEAAIQKREAYNLEIIPKIECFKNYTDIHAQVSKQSKKNTEISLALRCLIEHIVAEPINGTKKLDIAALDSCVAYMIHIINWGFVSDSLNFNITDTKISLLKSGRIGTEKSFDENVLSRYTQSKVNENIFYRNKYLSKTFSLPEIKTETKHEETDFDRAFHSEFKISYDDCVGITQVAIRLAFDEEESVCVIKKQDFITHLIEKYSIEEETIVTYISNFSLFNRGKVQNVKEHGFKNEDFYPWRYNRKLSLLRKPMVITQKDKDRYLNFGARSLYDFMLNLASLISYGRFQADSAEMKSYLSQINHENGKEFTNEVYSFFNEKLKDKAVVIKKEVGIKPNGLLKNSEDIGDIDTLIINNDDKRIISIECKYLNEPRTPYEMHLELLKFIDGDAPWIPKVDRRNAWILDNKKAFSTLGINDDIEKYSFEYVFLTNESISIPFIKGNDIKYRFMTFIELQNNLNLL